MSDRERQELPHPSLQGLGPIARMLVGPPQLHEHPRADRAHQARAELKILVDKFQRDHGLTDIELLQALTECQQSILKYMLRAERHPDDPDRGADEA
jgi:hypothetical protein